MEVRTPVFQPTGAPSIYAWPYTYTARRLDEETGLMHYRNRMYHPALGRCVSRDPVGYEAGDFNLDRFVVANPMDNVDPSGQVAANFETVKFSCTLPRPPRTLVTCFGKCTCAHPILFGGILQVMLYVAASECCRPACAVAMCVGESSRIPRPSPTLPKSMELCLAVAGFCGCRCTPQ